MDAQTVAPGSPVPAWILIACGSGMATAISWLAYRLFAKSVSRTFHDAEIRRIQKQVDEAMGMRESLRREMTAALVAAERRADETERALYERMLDAAYSAKRGGSPRPHRGDEEPIEARRERLRTVTMELSPAEGAEFAARLAAGLPAVPSPS